MNPRMKFLRRYIIGSASSPTPIDLFSYFELGNGNIGTESYIDVNTTPTIPQTHGGNVIWVGPDTFSGNTSVTGVTIQDGMTDIK